MYGRNYAPTEVGRPKPSGTTRAGRLTHTLLGETGAEGPHGRDQAVHPVLQRGSPLWQAIKQHECVPRQAGGPRRKRGSQHIMKNRTQRGSCRGNYPRSPTPSGDYIAGDPPTYIGRPRHAIVCQTKGPGGRQRETQSLSKAFRATFCEQAAGVHPTKATCTV